MDKSAINLDPLLTIEETAKALSTSEKTVRRRIAAGKLPVIRDGRIIRIRQKDLQAYIAMHRCE